MKFGVPFQPKSQWQGNGEEKRIQIEAGEVHEIGYEAKNQKGLDAKDQKWQGDSGCSPDRKNFKKAEKEYDDSNQNRNHQEQLHMHQLPFSGFSEMSNAQARYSDVFLSEYEEEECADIQDDRNQKGHGDGLVIDPAQFIEYKRQAETEQNQSHEQVVYPIPEKGPECFFLQRLEV